MKEFEVYKPRTVKFEKIVEMNDWKIKVYTITTNEKFQSNDVLENAIEKLPVWLENSKILKLPIHLVATLIVHEGKDRVWSLLNWWINGEMMQNFTYYTSYEDAQKFELVTSDGLMACVWEMSVICHERKAWIKHILKNADSPKFDEYLKDVIQGLI